MFKETCMSQYCEYSVVCMSHATCIENIQNPCMLCACYMHTTCKHAWQMSQILPSSPGGRNDRLVHTVMRMRLISEKSWKIVYSCPRPQNGGTEGRLELVLLGVFLLLSHTLWDRRIATSSRHSRQSALDSIYYIAANKPCPCNGLYEYSLRKLSACA